MLPAILVFGLVWHQHLCFIRTYGYFAAAAQSATRLNQNLWENTLYSFSMSLGIGLSWGCTALYRQYRSRIFKARKAQLERLWQIATAEPGSGPMSSVSLQETVLLLEDLWKRSPHPDS